MWLLVFEEVKYKDTKLQMCKVLSPTISRREQVKHPREKQD